MKLFRVIIILVLIFGLSNTVLKSAYSQDQDEILTYVVRSGDSFYSIANRFMMDLQDLLDANPEIYEAGLFAGDTLIIPGIDWISGELGFNSVGDTKFNLRNVGATNQVEINVISKLNGISSPVQYLFGREILLPKNEMPENFKAIVFSGVDSYLEIAAQNLMNPWGVVAENNLNGSWDLVSGRTLNVNSVSEEPYRILPEQVSVFETFPEYLFQGESLANVIQSDSRISKVTGKFGEFDMDFYRIDDETFISFQGIEVILDPGYYQFQVGVELENGDSYIDEYMVQINLGSFRYELLIVNEDLTGLDVGLQEREILQTAIQTSSETKLWDQAFAYPTNDPTYVTSLFGTRRSLNYSAYDYFHGGIDYGGYEGQDIYSAADGVVVFTGEMPIRGNATIIDHGWGVFTLYGHQSKFLVEVGEVVTRGQIIGLIGNTGRSSGPHVHWEVWVNGIQTSPLDWVVGEYPYSIQLP